MKVAILGGGVGAMTAAYWLTQPPPLGPGAEVTVHQLGWRLGGKGASGRNIEKAMRIEEHGMHIWMGWYANAFKLIRGVYGELGRPPDQPLANWREAFHPHTVFTLMQQEPDGQWMRGREWMLPYPAKPGQPGDQTGFPPPCGYIAAGVDWARERIERILNGFDHEGCARHELSKKHRAHLHALHALLKDACAHAGPPHQPGTRGEPNPLPHHHAILALALEGVQKVVSVGLDLAGDCTGVLRALLLTDVIVTIVLGIIRDLCGTTDWTIIDDIEWTDWLVQNGLSSVTQSSVTVRSFYDLLFAFKGGDRKHPNLAAGSATCQWLRISFDYLEALFMKMEASMGETIFTPFYDLLLQRGVKFEFFHRLRDVVPSADGTSIDSLRIGIQATTNTGTPYRPLFNVQGIDCWPSEVFYDQLEQGEELRARHIDLEDYDSGWPDVAELELKAGRDFDLVVFGLSLGAVPIVCSKLVAQNPQWAQMVANVETVETQSFQFWFTPNVAQLGWPPALDGRDFGERALLSAYVEPVDTWADMSQLLPIEQWDVPVNNIAYFCGVIAGRGTLERVRHDARAFLDERAQVLWTKSAPHGKFRYDWLAVNDPPAATDDQRFAYQFFRLNNQPTERYVQSIAGSTKYRLDPAAPGYANMVLAGDWVRNGLATGCVESAVLGGLKGVRNFCPGMVIIE